MAILKQEIKFPLKKFKGLILISLLFPLIFPGNQVIAQSSTPQSGPVYIIQPGDSLSGIAGQFGVSITDLMQVNNISDPNAISAGTEVIIPGLEGISGILNSQIIGFGETLRSISRQNQVDSHLLRKLNHITSPSELYAGVSLVLPQKEKATAFSNRITLENNESLLEVSVLLDTDPWTIARTNELGGTWDGNPGDILFRYGDNTAENKQAGLPSAIQKVEINPLPLTQGSTTVIKVSGTSLTALEGKMIDRPIHFFLQSDGSFAALQGIYALLTPGPYPLDLTATLSDGSKQSFEQMVIVKTPNNPYPNDPMLSVDPATIDPAVTQPEIDQITSITSTANPEKFWQDMFQLPVAQDYCVKSRFGNRRAYNGGGYDNFHAGLDFGICSATNPFDIFAPAAGVVVYTGKLIVRGNATIIDHGWGVYTGYWHQEDILVNVGDKVTTGQLIGHIGSTGRVTGPHLHWEVWVNGEQVNPTDWLNVVYP